MEIEQADFVRLPPHLQALFVQQSNPARDEVLAGFPDTKSGDITPYTRAAYSRNHPAGNTSANVTFSRPGDSGNAARFFYCAKASKADREEGLAELALQEAGLRNGSGDDLTRAYDADIAKRANHHPTVKPTDLMRYLVRLITPPGGTVLDPFTGSGSTGKAALLEGFSFIGCEMTPEYLPIAEARLVHALARYHSTLTPPSASVIP